MSAKRSGETRPAQQKPPQEQAGTGIAENGSTPKLPHEHDESSDSQSHGVRPIIRQAHDDIESGQLDTGRDPAMQQAYQRQKESPADDKKKARRP